MKKMLLSFCFLLWGCSSGYHLNRNTDSDRISFAILHDQKSNISSPKLADYEIHDYVCDERCADTIQRIEQEHMDGLIIMGDLTLAMMKDYVNVNQIPIIEIRPEDELEALKKMFPEYAEWGTSDAETADTYDVYYYKENETVTTDKPFYQKNNPLSMITLIEDYEQLSSDIAKKIQEIAAYQLREHEIIVYWKKK